MPTPPPPHRRQTLPGVRRNEAIARVLIASGGFGTILSVVFIFAFLFYVVLPLAAPSEVAAPRVLPLTPLGVVAAGTDDLALMCWTIERDGHVRVAELATGRELMRQALFGDATPTAWSHSPGGAEFAAGFGDGTLRGGRIAVTATFPEAASIPAALRGLKRGESAPHMDGMLTVTREGQFRLQRVAAELTPPLVSGPAAIAALDFLRRDDGTFTYAVLDGSGAMRIHVETEREDWMTGEKVRELETTPIPYVAPEGAGAPSHLRLTGSRSSALVLWREGLCQRYDIRIGETPKLVEARDLGEGGSPLTIVEWLLGRTTLIVGDEAGGARGWFLTKPASAETADGALLTRAHEYPPGSAAVTCLAASSRTRIMLLGYADGGTRLVQATHATTLAELDRAPGGLLAVALAPKDDGILRVARGGSAFARLELKHSEVTARGLFSKVWYEGYERPEHAWQSTGGTDDFELKLGLWPLIFGTIKATLYAMLIAAPIALLAAVFTSEFMVAKRRTNMKAAVEMMASLPSVVLGFLAALIVAPFVQGRIPGMLLSFVTVPLTLLFGARLWQLLPAGWALRLSGWPRFATMAVALAAGVGLAGLLGPWMERAWFLGDFVKWVGDRDRAAPFGGRFLVLFPICTAVVLAGTGMVLGPALRRLSARWSDLACALLDLGRYVVLLLLSVLATWLSAQLAGPLGWDPRGGIFGPYAQRNALVVGCMMGFAIVPIIYTIAEDALSSVPRHLREASLGAGATPWQTAWRVVIPTAMSGIFGALMVGFGRAIGETMIVLMAAGNTAILDWNMFEGFRTLSANIATEMMEAPEGGTHYRVLFLTALVLFAMTFVLNTGVEAMRRIFRKRFASL